MAKLNGVKTLDMVNGVKLLNRSGLVSRDIPIGTIGELAGDVNEELPAQFINKFTDFQNYVVADNLELITPVEQRFDLEGGGDPA